MTDARSLSQALADSPAGALVRRVTDSQKVAAALAGADIALPPSFDALQAGACEVRESTLLLYVGSPALAAKVRQSLPQLLASLHRHGFELTEIKVRLQPERTSYRASVDAETVKEDASENRRHPAGWIPNSRAALDLADKLALTFPGSGLGQAAARLASRLRRRVAQSG